MGKPTIPLLITEENKIAFSAIERLHRREGWTGQELVFLHGPAGEGKSMLVKHLVKLEKRKRPKQSIEHLTSAEFSARFTEAAASQTIDQFQQQFQDLDLLICEDVGAINTRKEVQSRLILAIDAVEQRGGRVLLTANRSPGRLYGFHPKFINRCHGGICVKIRPLNQNSRLKMITHFASCQQIVIPGKVVQKLATTLTGSIRDLLGVVTQLDAIARIQKSSIDIQLCTRYLKGEVEAPKPGLKAITRIVSQEFGVKVGEIRSAARDRRFVLARQCAMYLAREVGKKPLQEIAHYFGGRNHSTVIHSCKRFQQRLSSDAALEKELQEILQRLGIPADQLLITC